MKKKKKEFLEYEVPLVNKRNLHIDTCEEFLSVSSLSNLFLHQLQETHWEWMAEETRNRDKTLWMMLLFEILAILIFQKYMASSSFVWHIYAWLMPFVDYTLHVSLLGWTTRGRHLSPVLQLITANNFHTSDNVLFNTIASGDNVVKNWLSANGIIKLGMKQSYLVVRVALIVHLALQLSHYQKRIDVYTANTCRFYRLDSRDFRLCGLNMD